MQLSNTYSSSTTSFLFLRCLAVLHLLVFWNLARIFPLDLFLCPGPLSVASLPRSYLTNGNRITTWFFSGCRKLGTNVLDFFRPLGTWIPREGVLARFKADARVFSTPRVPGRKLHSQTSLRQYLVPSQKKLE